MTITKKNNNNSFISALATTTLGEIQPNPSVEKIEAPATTKIGSSIEEPKTMEILQPKPSVKANKSNLFIQDLMNTHYTNHGKGTEKTPTHIDKTVHFKIKLISTFTKISMFDLTNAILTDYLDKHKNEIDNLLKKANY